MRINVLVLAGCAAWLALMPSSPAQAQTVSGAG